MKRGRQSPRKARRSGPKATLLYAWAVPAYASSSPVDHTWVTSYDNRVTPYADVQQVAADGEFYWYCWGSFHSWGGTPNDRTGFLGQQLGNLALAQCLVEANADSRIVPAARGTIFTYGFDGVCHQLANQVLYSTGTGNAEPLTVRKARGYMASVFIYGTYGLQEAAWRNQIARCGGQPIEPPEATPDGSPRTRCSSARTIGRFRSTCSRSPEERGPEIAQRPACVACRRAAIFRAAVAGSHCAGCRPAERPKSAYAGPGRQATRAAEVRGDIRVPARSEN